MLESFEITHEPIGGWPIEITPPRAPAKAIIAEVAKAHGFEPAELTGPGLRRPLCRARTDAMKRVRSELNYSLPQIGRLFGRHHTTVLFAIRKPQGDTMPADTIGHNGAPDMAGVDLTQKLDAAAAAYQRHFGRPRTISKLQQMADARAEAQRVLEEPQRG